MHGCLLCHHSLTKIYGNVPFQLLWVQCSARSTLLLLYASSFNVCRYMHTVCVWVLYSTCFILFTGSVLLEMTKPPSPLPLPPSHHHPPVPKGSSTQINWKKDECSVVLPLHLSERESRRGRTHGPNRRTISLHLSQTVSSLMGWNIAHKYIYFYIIYVYSLTGAQASTNYQKHTHWLFVSHYLPPTT